MSLRVYNTLGQKKEEFEPVEDGKVRMYCCGPTVYDFLHVGNFRGAVFYNFARNWLEHLGYKVTYVYNFTDVDDKIINRAKDEGVHPKEIAERYIEEFWKDFLALELRPHDRNPRVTEFIPEIVRYIERLIEGGKAYVVNGEVLYSVRSFVGYGKLSGRNPDDMLSGARVEIDEKKRDPLDFALWKPSKPGEQGWPSPWGEGRPGWHIECTVMIDSVLGEGIDIHGGGMDLIFPHHENEIAQGEGCGHKPYVRYWLHNNLFTFDGQKMSKSLGNIRTMRSFLGQYNAEIFKFMVLSVHYRSLSDFSDAAINQAVTGLSRFYSALSLAHETLKQGESKEVLPEFKAKLENLAKEIEEAANDDFNTPKMFASLFEAIRAFNGLLKRGQKVKPPILGACRAFIDFIDRYGRMLALFQKDPDVFLRTLDDMLLAHKGLKREEIDILVEQRARARQNKDWAKSDEFRDRLNAMGIAVQDLPQGSYWEVAK